MLTNEVLIICTVSSILFIVMSLLCLVLLPVNDCAKYKKYLTFRREDIGHKMDADSQDDVREWYNNKIMYSRYSKLPNRHRVLSAYQYFLILFVMGVLLAFIPFSILNDKGGDGFVIFFQTIFMTIRSFFWGSSFESLYPECVKLPVYYLHYMSVIFVVAGLVIATSIFKLFKEFFAYLKYWAIHPLSDIYVFSKLNEKSIALAEDIFKNTKQTKTIKKQEDREKDIEQTLFYIENEYKYKKMQIDKFHYSKRERKVRLKEIKLDREKKIKESFNDFYVIKDAYKVASAEYKTARSKERTDLKELKRLKNIRHNAKVKYKSKYREYNELLVNTVEKGYKHVFAKIKYIFTNLGLFLFYTIIAVLVGIIILSILILIFMIYVIPFALIEVIYLLGGVLGFKVAVAKLKDGYIDIWKYCQVFATRHVIDVFVFCDNHSKWFDSLFHKRRIYFCDVYPKSKDYHDELIDRANYIGATVMKRDVTELRMKWWCRSRTIYLISDDDNENTEQAVFLQNACMRSKTQKKILNCNKTEIYVFASNYESEFVIDDLNNKIVKDRVDLINDMITKGGRIDNESFDIMRIRRVNEYNNFATNFFWNRYGKFFDDTDNEINELNVVFIGCGKYGREFVKTLCCLGQLPNYRLTINIFDRDIEKVKASLPKALLQNGGLPLSLDSQSDKGGPIYAITFEQCLADVSNVDFLNNVMLNPTHVFVMLGDDELNIRTAMLLRTKLRRENNNLKPKIYAVVNDYQRHYNLKQGDALYKYDIRPIGRTITRYSEQAIQQKYIERWAKVVHTSFLLNDKLSDVLCSNSDDYSFKNYCEKYRKERGCEIPESFFDLLKQINVNPVIDISYPVFLHKMYRSWQKVVADKIKDVDISNIYEMRNLVCEILNNMVVSSEDNSIYINAIIDKVRRLNKDYSIDVNTVEDLVKGLLDELPRWRDDLQQRVTANKIIELTDYFSFDKREYFRRSSKSRALYEHILLGKQMIKYTPESHSVKINKNLSKIRFSDSVWESLEKDMNYSALGINDNDSQQKILLQWETGQWYVLNDLMQKRWMAFMWGEGYIYQSFDDKTGRTDIIEKTHKYLKPYIDIFNSDSDRIRQTMEIILVDK